MTRTITILLSMLAVSCTNTSEPAPVFDYENTAIFSTASAGGCDRGNGCSTLSVYNNGAFKVSIGREIAGKQGVKTVIVKPYIYNGTVDPAALTQWKKLRDKQNFKSLIKQLKPGRSIAPSDGVDYFLTIEKDGKIIPLSSIQYNLDYTIPFFQESFELNQRLTMEAWEAKRKDADQKKK